MIGLYLTKVKEQYRVEYENQVAEFNQLLKESNEFTLEAFSYKKKEVKKKGEVVEEYYVVEVTKSFNDIKEPTHTININYEVE